MKLDKIATIFGSSSGLEILRNQPLQTDSKSGSQDQ